MSETSDPAREYEGRRIVVAGAGVSGVPVAEALLSLGAKVQVVDRAAGAGTERLADAGAEILLGATTPPAGTDAVITSPGWRPDHPLLAAAAGAGIEVYSEPELAWRLRSLPTAGRPGSPPARWLAVTGTNGKTTTVTMLAAILAAAGRRCAAVGNIGEPLLTAALAADGAGPAYEVLAVELSSFQLHWSSRLAPAAGVILNLADDHLDWHGGFDPYAEAKTAVWRGNRVSVGNADDDRVTALLDVHGTSRRIGFTLDIPRPGELGVVDGILVDRAFGPSPTEAVELGVVDDVKPVGRHNVANALAAAALARADGVSAAAVTAGLRGYVPEPHRNAFVARVGGVTYVNDSKATNPHAALASLTAYHPVVWIAGGQLKGVSVDDLVATVAPRLAGAVLLGVDRAEVAAALARHAPDVPVVTVDRSDDGAMTDVVTAASRLAREDDVVLLAPAAASLDMFASYGRRGDAFASAVRALEQPETEPASSGPGRAGGDPGAV